MQKTCLFLILFSLSWAAYAQYPLANPAPQGIVVQCGNQIPVGFSYRIERSEAGRNAWKQIATIQTEADSSAFFAKLFRLGALNPVFNLKDPNQRPYLWKIARRAKVADSLGIFRSNTVFLQALGLAYYDTTAVKNTLYEYRIATLGSKASGIAEGKTAPVSFPQRTKVNYALHTLRAEPFETKVVLQYLPGRGKPTPAGLTVYRRVYMQTDFEEIGDMAYFRQTKDTILLAVTDRAVRRQLTYEYVAVPLDAYGNAGLPSDTVRLVNLIDNLTLSVYQLKAVSLTAENAIKLSWRLQNPANTRVINIYRSQNYDQPEYTFVGSVTANDTTFTDWRVKPVEGYWYILVVNGVYGQAPASPRVHGLLKTNPKRIPLSPNTVRVVQTGNSVRISWEKADAETRGYIVYRGEDASNLRPISPEIPLQADTASFVDKIDGGQSVHYYYAVQTVNTAYNRSGYSALAEIMTTPAIKIQVPLRIHVKYVDKKALVYWANPNTSGVAGFNLYRKENGGEFKKLNTEMLPTTRNQWEDLTLISGKPYEYVVEFVGINGGANVRTTSASLALEAAVPPQPVGLRVLNTEGGVEIRWSAMPAGSAQGYILYRQTGDDKPEKIATLPLGQTVFTDKKSPKGLVFYTITSVSTESIESKTDNWISVSR
jgi:fibronectin type 3 domain-containing protein